MAHIGGLITSDVSLSFNPVSLIFPFSFSPSVLSKIPQRISTNAWFITGRFGKELYFYLEAVCYSTFFHLATAQLATWKHGIWIVDAWWHSGWMASGRMNGGLNSRAWNGI
jgi:hypothetical protein